MKHSVILGSILLAFAVVLVGVLAFWPRSPKPDVPPPKTPPKKKETHKQVVENYPSGKPHFRYRVFVDRPEVKDGEYVELFEDGKEKVVATYKENVLQGECSENYPSGSKKNSCLYQDGIRHGAYKYWYKTSQLAVKGSFENGRKNGRFEQWHESGTLKMVSYYRGGFLHGTHTEYYDKPGNVPLLEKEYVHNKLDGRVTYFHPDGHPKLIFQYKNDEKIKELPIPKRKPALKKKPDETPVDNPQE